MQRSLINKSNSIETNGRSDVWKAIFLEGKCLPFNCRQFFIDSLSSPVNFTLLQVPREFRARSHSPNPYSNNVSTGNYQSSLEHKDFLSENYYYDKMAQKSQGVRVVSPQQQRVTSPCRLHNDHFNQVSYFVHFTRHQIRLSHIFAFSSSIHFLLLPFMLLFSSQLPFVWQVLWLVCCFSLSARYADIFASHPQRKK